MQLNPEELTVLRALRQQLTNEQDIVLLDKLITASETSILRQHNQNIIDSSIQFAIAGDMNGSIVINGGDLEQLKNISYAEWRTQQNQWLEQCFRSATDSDAYLGQRLNVAGESVHLIERTTVWQQLNIWLQEWKEIQRPMVIIGDEGNGKTWAVAGWLQRCIVQQPLFPAVVFLSSNVISSNVPLNILLDTVAQRIPITATEQAQIELTLSADARGQSYEELSSKRAERSVNLWLNDKDKDWEVPLAILVLDGINERQNYAWWRELLAVLQTEEWSKRIAVIITCRQQYWQRYFEQFQANTYKLGVYNEQEFREALNVHGLRRSDISDSLLILSQKPRFLDRLLKYHEYIAESGDPTVARLFYEDWRDRFKRKRSLPIDDTTFHNFLRELAEKYRLNEKLFRDRELIGLLPLPDSQVLEELRTSGVFHEHNGKYEVQDNHLVLALALLLIDELEHAVSEKRDVSETISEWLEQPHLETDFKARICEAAVVQALYNKAVPVDTRVALLLVWMTSKNIDPAGFENFRAYFPADRQSYFVLAEHIWSETVNHGWGQQALMHTFLYWFEKEHDTQEDIWQQQLDRWLGFVHRSYYPYFGQKSDEEAQRIQQATNERLGYELQLGSFDFAGHQLTAIDDDGLIRLGRTALALISHVPRESYIRAIATGCVAEAIMNHPDKYDLFAWIIRSSQRSLWPLVKLEVEQLLKTSNRITQQVTYRLLSFIGNAEALQIQEALPNDLFPLPEILQRRLNDPCTSGFSWCLEDCERCVGREDLTPDWIARQIASYCIDPLLPVPKNIGVRLAPIAATIDIQSMHAGSFNTSADLNYDQYEPSLCAYAPEAIADVVLRFVYDIARRDAMPLRQLSLALHNHSLLFTQVEEEVVFQAWQRLHQKGELIEKVEVEAEGFLFREVLRQLDAQEQLTQLLCRSEQANDYVFYEQYFKQITKWDGVWQYFTSTSSIKTISRLLWFMAKYAVAIPVDNVETYILPFIYHDESFVRAMAFRVIFGSISEQALNIVLQEHWSWNTSNHDEENQWGSLILAEYGLQLPFSQIINRIHPTYLGYAVYRRGNKPDEVAAYATNIHLYWQLIGLGTPELPVDFPVIYLEDFCGWHEDYLYPQAWFS